MLLAMRVVKCQNLIFQIGLTMKRIGKTILLNPLTTQLTQALVAIGINCLFTLLDHGRTGQGYIRLIN